jgi:hypothetical protein
MKRFFMMILVAALLCTPTILMAASCDSGEAGYFVAFTFEGTAYRVSLGFSDVDEGEAFATVDTSETPGTIIMGTDGIFATDVSGPPMDSVYAVLVVVGTSAGTYEYSSKNASALVGINGGTYMADSGTIVVTSFGAVGEAVEGTFNMDLAAYTIEGDDYQTLAGMPITGSFRVKRVADNTSLPFN